MNTSVLIFFGCMILSTGIAQENDLLGQSTPLRVTKIHGGIIFDGVPDEAVWESIEELPLVMYKPVFGGEPTEKSIKKIAYDDEYLYLSGRLYYQNPADIRAYQSHCASERIDDADNQNLTFGFCTVQ